MHEHAVKNPGKSNSLLLGAVLCLALLIIGEYLGGRFFLSRLTQEISLQREHEAVQAGMAYFEQIKQSHISKVTGYACWDEMAFAMEKGDTTKVINMYSGDNSLREDFDVFMVLDGHGRLVYGCLDGVSTDSLRTEVERQRNRELEALFLTKTAQACRVYGLGWENNRQGYIQQVQNIATTLVWHGWEKYNGRLRLLTVSPICTNNGFPYTEGCIIFGQSLAGILTQGRMVLQTSFMVTMEHENPDDSLPLVGFDGKAQRWLQITPTYNVNQTLSRFFYLFLTMQLFLMAVILIAVVPAFYRRYTNWLHSTIEEHTATLRERNREIRVKSLHLQETMNQLAQSKQEAEQANHIKTRLLAKMSHEMRTPLNGILGMLKLISMQPQQQPTPEQLEYLDFSARMLEIVINDLLDLGDLEHGKSNPVYKQFSLYTVLTDLMNMFRLPAVEKKLYLTLESTLPTETLLIGDSEKLRRILYCLLDNAVKFVEKGGVVLKVGLVRHDNDKTWYSFAVQDTGPGFSKIEQDRIFDGLSQNKESGPAYEEGDDQGLAIAGKMVSLLHGSITLVSQPGQGSLFTVEIPFKKGEADYHDTVSAF